MAADIQPKNASGHMKPGSITALFVTYNSVVVLPGALHSFENSPYISKCIVVDNASVDATCEILERDFPNVTLIRNQKNLGFGRASNIGFEQVKTEYILFMNPDARLHEDTLDKLVAAANAYPEAALIAPQLVDREGRHYFNFRPDIFRYERNPNEFLWAGGDACVDFITGALWLMRTDALRAVGYFDESIFMYCEDDDLCLRLRKANYPLIIVGDATATHYGSMSSCITWKTEYFKHRHMMYARLCLEAKYHEGRIHRRWLIRKLYEICAEMWHHAIRLRRIATLRMLGKLKGIYDYFRLRNSNQPYY